MQIRRAAPPSHSGKQPFYYGYVVVIGSFIILMFALGAYLSFGVFFKPLLAEFGLDRATTSGIVSLSMLIQGLLGVMVGRLNDRYGPRIVLTVCGVLTGAGFLLMSRVSTLWHLYLVYGVILGIGLSGLMVPLMSTVARWFTKNRGTMSGIMLGGVGLGTLVTPPIATWLLSLYDWRTAYLVMGSFNLVILVLAAQFLRRDPSKVRHLSHAFNEEYERGLEVGSEGVLLNDAVKTRQFWFVLPTFFISGFCRFVLAVHIVPYATEVGISAFRAANILAVMGGLSIITRPAVGNIADRIGNRKVFIVIYILTSLGMLLLLSARAEWVFYFAAIMFSLNWGLTSAEAPLVAELFGLKSLGAIFGFMGLSYSLGGAAGPLVAGYIFDVTDSYTIAFLLCVALCISGVILVSLLRPLPGKSLH